MKMANKMSGIFTQKFKWPESLKKFVHSQSAQICGIIEKHLKQLDLILISSSIPLSHNHIFTLRLSPKRIHDLFYFNNFLTPFLKSKKMEVSVESHHFWIDDWLQIIFNRFANCTLWDACKKWNSRANKVNSKNEQFQWLWTRKWIWINDYVVG